MNNLQVTAFKTANKYSSPTKHQLNPGAGIAMSENDFFHISIEAEEKLPSDVQIWLGDFRFPLELINRDVTGRYHYMPLIDTFFHGYEKDKFSASFDSPNGQLRLFKLFLNYFGRCAVELEYNLNDVEVYQDLGFVDIHSEKIKEISGLLEYLFDNDFYLWNIISLTKADATEEGKVSENILWKLRSLREITTEFRNNFIPQISISKITKLSPTNKVRSWSDNESISDSSIMWFIENPHNLILTSVSDENHFLLFNKPYRSDVIFSETLEEHTDVYENRLMHWFVKIMYEFVQQVKPVVQIKYEQYVAKKDVLKFGIYSSYFKRLKSFISSLEQELEEINAAICEHIPVLHTEVDEIQDQRLQNKEHYRTVYQHLVRWLENKQVNYSPDILFSGLKDISKLYEVYCLLKIIDTLVNELNFSLVGDILDIRALSTQFDPFSVDETEMASSFEFSKDNIKLNLYYDKLPTSLITTSKHGGRGFRPDFVFEIEKGGSLNYIIMDAKYKTINNIEQFDYTELCLKYLHGIGPIEGGEFPVSGLFVLNPIAGSSVNFYHRSPYSLYDHKPSIPAIGRIEMSVDPNQPSYIRSVIERLISLM